MIGTVISRKCCGRVATAFDQERMYVPCEDWCDQPEGLIVEFPVRLPYEVVSELRGYVSPRNPYTVMAVCYGMAPVAALAAELAVDVDVPSSLIGEVEWAGAESFLTERDKAAEAVYNGLNLGYRRCRRCWGIFLPTGLAPHVSNDLYWQCDAGHIVAYDHDKERVTERHLVMVAEQDYAPFREGDDERGILSVSDEIIDLSEVDECEDVAVAAFEVLKKLFCTEPSEGGAHGEVWYSCSDEDAYTGVLTVTDAHLLGFSAEDRKRVLSLMAEYRKTYGG